MRTATHMQGLDGEEPFFICTMSFFCDTSFQLLSCYVARCNSWESEANGCKLLIYSWSGITHLSLIWSHPSFSLQLLGNLFYQQKSDSFLIMFCDLQVIVTRHVRVAITFRRSVPGDARPFPKLCSLLNSRPRRIPGDRGRYEKLMQF